MATTRRYLDRPRPPSTPFSIFLVAPQILPITRPISTRSLINMAANNAGGNVEGALFTTPLPLASLEESDRSCPICLEPYVEPARPGHGHSGAGEWPVRVDMIADRSGIRRLCRHVFGRACLETYFHSPAPWRNSCPLCRDIWFNIVVTNDPIPDEEPREEEQGNAPPVSLRRSNRIAARRTPLQPPPPPTRPIPRARPERRTVGGLTVPRGSNPRARRTPRGSRVPPASNPPARSPNFLQQLLGLLEVESGSDVVKGTLEQVESRLEELYEGL